MADVITALKLVQFVVDANGKKTGALLSMAAWEALLDWIENQEDAAIIKQALTELKAAKGLPEKAGWLAWDTVKDDWNITTSLQR